MKRFLFTVGVLSLFSVGDVLASGYDWYSCGIKPPPPVNCIHCKAQCQCSGKACQWVWINK